MKETQLPAVLAKHQPKPTVAQVRRATATALADDYAAETERLRTLRDNLEKTIGDSAIRHIRKHVRTMPYGTSIYNGEVTIKFELDRESETTPEPIRQLLKQREILHNSLHYRPRKTAKEFEAELRDAAAGLTTPIEATLLADPVLKQALLEAGKKPYPFPPPPTKPQQSKPDHHGPHPRMAPGRPACTRPLARRLRHLRSTPDWNHPIR